MSGLHSAQTAADGIHVVQAFEVANAAARAALFPVAAGDVGKIIRQLDNDSFWLIDTTTTSFQLGTGGSASVFGTGYAYAERTTLLTTTVVPPTFTEYLSLTTPSLVAGNYKIEWSLFNNFASTTNDFVARVQVDDTTDVMDPGNGGVMQEEPKDSGGGGNGNQRLPRKGDRDLALTAGVHTIDLDFASSNGSTARLFYATLRCFRVS